MFQENHITESLNGQTRKEEILEFPCGIQRGRIIYDMVVNMRFVDVGRNDESVGDFSLILSYDLINTPILSPIFSAFITAQTSRNTAAIVAIPRTTRISKDCHKAFTMQ